MIGESFEFDCILDVVAHAQRTITRKSRADDFEMLLYIEAQQVVPLQKL